MAGLHKLVVLVISWDDHGLIRGSLLALALLLWRRNNGLTVRVKELVLALHQLDGLPLFEFLNGLGESDVQDLAALGRAMSSIKRIRNTGIDRWGRRPLLIFGSFALGAFLAIVGALQFHADSLPEGNARVPSADGIFAGNDTAQIILMLDTDHHCAQLYVSICSSSVRRKFEFANTHDMLLTASIRWGPGPWLLGAEIFPLRARAKGMALSTTSNWICNFIIAFITPPLFAAIDGGYYFILLGFLPMRSMRLAGFTVWVPPRTVRRQARMTQCTGPRPAPDPGAGPRCSTHLNTPNPRGSEVWLARPADPMDARRPAAILSEANSHTDAPQGARRANPP